MSFYVTLPSNSSTNLFDNVISNFTTQLQVPIRLNGPYEVGLVEFSYDHYWDVDIGNLSYYHSDKFLFQVPVIHRDGESLDKLISRINTNLGTYIVHYEMEKLKTTHPNATSESIQKHIVEKFLQHREFSEREKITIKNSIPFVFYNKITNEIIANTISDKDNYKFSGEIANILGLKDIFLNTKSPPIRVDPLHDSGVFINNSLYIYTDIIKYQYVGDTLAPLLRNVIVPSKSNLSTECVIYDSPHYIPVCNSSIDTINIKIADEYGNNIRFKRGKAIVKLHFRPTKYGF